MQRRFWFSFLVVVLGFWVLFLALPSGAHAAVDARPPAQGSVVVYTDRIAFLSAYPTVSIEGFETHQFGGSVPCQTPLSSSSYTPCFHPGDLAANATYSRIGSGGLPAGSLMFVQSPTDTYLVLRQTTGVLEAMEVTFAAPVHLVALAADKPVAGATGSMNTDDLFIGLVAYDANHEVVYGTGSMNIDDLYIGLYSPVPITSVALTPSGGSVAVREVMFGP